jgi:hypothetical protein
MRWQELFADLEAQARSLEHGDDQGELPDRIRGEIAQVTLMNRLRAQVSRQLSVSVQGVGDIAGSLQRTGADWILLSQAEEEIIVPLGAVLAVRNLPPDAVSPNSVGTVAGALRLTAVLRAAARDRGAVIITRRDGLSLAGTPDRVGADFVDLALHDVAEAPRREQVRSRTTLSLAAIACIRRRPSGWHS